MTVSSSSRLAITRWSAGADPYTRAQRDADNATLDDLVAIDAQGLEAALPAATTRGRYYYSTDTRRLRRSTGSAWVEVPTLAATGELTLGDASTTDAALTVGADVDTVALELIGQTGAAGTDPVAVVNDRATGDPVAVVDTDGATRLGDGATRGAMLTVQGQDAAERVLALDSAGPGGLTEHLIYATTQASRRFVVDALGRVYLSAKSDNAEPPTPTGGGMIYCSTAGDLYYKSSAGNVRLLAAH